MMSLNGKSIHEHREWWVAYFAATITHALKMPPKDGADLLLKPTMSRFRRSPACTEELARLLKEGK